jgi:hypothetical protein
MAEPVTTTLAVASFGISTIGGIVASGKEKEEAIQQNKWSMEDLTTLYGAQATADKANYDAMMTADKANYDAMTVAEKAKFDADLDMSKTLYNTENKANWAIANLQMGEQAAENRYAAGVVGQKGALAVGTTKAQAGYSGVRGNSPLYAIRQEERLQGEALNEQIRSGNAAVTGIGTRAKIQSSILTDSYNAKVKKLTTDYTTSSTLSKAQYDANAALRKAQYDSSTTLSQAQYETSLNRLKSYNEYMDPLWDETPEERAAREAREQATSDKRQTAAQRRAERKKERKNRTRITPQIYGQDW